MVSSDSDSLVWGLVPANSDLEEPNSRHFSKRNAVKIPASDRYLSSVWTAFSRRVDPGSKRYLIVGPRVEFVDVDEGAPCPEGGILVPSDYQVGHEIEQAERASAITQNIASWAEKNHVFPSALKKSGREHPRSAVCAPQEGSLLARLIAELDQSDQRRLAIPLDIIAKLVNARVK
jgi:hypothetical protein